MGTIVIHTIFWTFSKLRLTRPSGPIRYSILKEPLLIFTAKTALKETVIKTTRDAHLCTPVFLEVMRGQAVLIDCDMPNSIDCGW